MDPVIRVKNCGIRIQNLFRYFKIARVKIPLFLSRNFGTFWYFPVSQEILGSSSKFPELEFILVRCDILSHATSDFSVFMNKNSKISNYVTE